MILKNRLKVTKKEKGRYNPKSSKRTLRGNLLQWEATKSTNQRTEQRHNFWFSSSCYTVQASIGNFQLNYC